MPLSPIENACADRSSEANKFAGTGARVMKILLSGVVALTAAVLIPSIASAQRVSQRDPGMEFGIDVLYQLESDVDFDGGSRIDADDDIGASLYFGYRFNPKFELNTLFDWNELGYDGVLQSASFPNVTANVK